MNTSETAAQKALEYNQGSEIDLMELASKRRNIAAEQVKIFHERIRAVKEVLKICKNDEQVSDLIIDMSANDTEEFRAALNTMEEITSALEMVEMTRQTQGWDRNAITAGGIAFAIVENGQVSDFPILEEMWLMEGGKTAAFEGAALAIATDVRAAVLQRVLREFDISHPEEVDEIDRRVSFNLKKSMHERKEEILRGKDRSADA